MNYGTLRTLARLGISVGLLAGCSATGSSNSALNNLGSGATGTGGSSPGSGGTTSPIGSGGSGNAINNIGGSSGSISGPANDGVVPNDDPSNPAITHPACGIGTCTDFPDQPLMGDGVPANAPTLFGDPSNMIAGSLCVLEPQLSSGTTAGVMIPANWLRPRFKFNGGDSDLFEIRIKNPAEKNELVAYTKSTTWYLPKEIWAGMGTPGMDNVPASGNGAANNGAGAPFTVTIRGVKSSAPGKPVGVSGDFNVAPVVASGSMVFWTVNSAMVTPD